MTASPDDYLWFEEDYPLGLNFCVTLVRGLTPDEVITRFGGTEAVDITGAHRLETAAEQIDYPDPMNDDGSFNADLGTGLDFIAATGADGWTLIVEPNGLRCSSEESARLLSPGGELVSFYYNENTAPVLRWAHDSETLVTFDPSGGAGWRSGTDPDRLNPVLESLGFDLSTEELDPADPRWHYDEQWQARTVALMEHLTGVRISGDLLADATFRCAAVPDPRSLAWMRANPTRIGPWTVEELAVQARSRLAAYAADPDRDEDDDWVDHDEYGDDEQQEGAGWIGADPHRWGERSPNDRLRHVGGNVQGMEQIDLPLVFDLSEARDVTLRSIAVWAAERAYEAAGLMDLPWTAPALSALREGRPLPPPFDDPAAVWPHLDTVPITTVRSYDGRHDRVLGAVIRLMVQGQRLTLRCVLSSEFPQAESERHDLTGAVRSRCEVAVVHRADGELPVAARRFQDFAQRVVSTLLTTTDAEHLRSFIALLDLRQCDVQIDEPVIATSSLTTGSRLGSTPRWSCNNPARLGPTNEARARCPSTTSSRTD